MTIPTYESGMLQIKAYRILQLGISSALTPFDLNASQWSLLGQIYEQPNGLKPVDIAKLLGVEPALVSIISEPLIVAGIMKKISHHQDKRAKLLILTPEGLKLVEKVEKELRHRLDHLLSGVSPKDLKAYQTVLEAIVQNGQAR